MNCKILKEEMVEVSEDDVMIHRKTSTVSKKNWKSSTACLKCGNRVNFRQLRRHLEGHQKGKYLCSLCFCIFNKFQYLATHKAHCLKKCLKHQLKPPECDNQSLPQWFNLSHAQNGSFPCPLCPEELGSLAEFHEHIVIHDTATETFTCGPCSAVFFHMGDLQKHMFQHVLADQKAKIH